MKKILIATLLLINNFAFSQKVDTVLYQEAYTSYFSFDLKNPIMVSYNLYHGGVSCNRDFFKFTGADVKSTKIANAMDYAKSGYDKGHLANAEDFAYNCTLDESTFRYWNCLPQTPELNRGIWKINETEIRKLSQTDSLLILCGGIYGKHSIGNNVFVPDTCWKVVYSYKINKIVMCVTFTNTSTPIITQISFDKLNIILKTRYNVNLSHYIKS
jgi:DNA/RNA endonuclease G (NUC1)